MSGEMCKAEKKELRRTMVAMRRAMDSVVKSEYDAAIAEAVTGLAEYAAADTALCYISKPPVEVGTNEIVRRSLECGMRVAAPVSEPGGVMKFYIIRSTDDLVVGMHDIYEPAVSRCELLESVGSEVPGGSASRSICIVPALAYDMTGHRLGWGGGYYDRYLKDFEGVRIGICYEENIVDTVPADEHDQCVDIVVTEKRVMRIR